MTSAAGLIVPDHRRVLVGLSATSTPGSVALLFGIHLSGTASTGGVGIITFGGAMPFGLAARFVDTVDSHPRFVNDLAVQPGFSREVSVGPRFIDEDTDG